MTVGQTTMLVHNYMQKRSRLLREIRAASVAYIWHMNFRTPQGKRASTLAAKGSWSAAATFGNWETYEQFHR